MDFAPYQSSPPEHSRAFSPPPGSPLQQGEAAGRRSFSPTFQRPSPPPLQHPQPQRGWQRSSSLANNGEFQQPQAGGGPAAGGEGAAERGGFVSEFDTSLGVRLDYEAAACYLALPPLGSIVLLIFERKSDYVRFHAWQASLLFTAVFVLHLVFSWSSFLSWFFFIGDLVLMAWLAMRAYRDADTLDRFEVPFVGRLASRILDDE